MVKYKCPKCGTLYDGVPARCVTCGVEFLPADQQDQPKSVAPAPVEEVAPAPVVAPVVEESVKEEVAPVVEEPKVEEAPKVEEQPKAEEPAPAPVEEAPKEEPAPVQEQYNEASEMNFSTPKAKVPGRVIVGFIFAFVTIALFGFTNYLPFLRSMKPDIRVYMGMGFAVATFIFAIMTLAFTGKPERYEAGRKMAVAAKVLGIIFLIFSILNLLAWGGLGVCYIMSDQLVKSTHFDFKATIDNFFMTGNFILVKVTA